MAVFGSVSGTPVVAGSAATLVASRSAGRTPRPRCPSDRPHSQGHQQPTALHPTGSPARRTAARPRGPSCRGTPC